MDIQTNRIVIGFIKILISFSYIVGIFPFRYIESKNVFESSLSSKGLSLFFILLGVMYSLFTLMILNVYRGYVDFEFKVKTFTHILYVTGTPIMAFCINLKHHHKIKHYSLTLLKTFRMIHRKFRRNLFQFDYVLIILFVVKLRLISHQLQSVDWDLFLIRGGIGLSISLTSLISSFLYLNFMVIYLMIGAMFDNIWLTLESNHDRICRDRQIEGKGIHLDEINHVYLKLRNCFRKLQLHILTPFWLMALSYFVLIVVTNYRQMYFGYRNDKEEQIITTELYNFLILVVAAALVPFKANRVERWFGVLCIKGNNSQRTNLDWIDFSRIIFPEYRIKPFGRCKFEAFGFLVKSVIFVKLIQLFTSKYEFFLKDGKNKH